MVEDQHLAEHRCGLGGGERGVVVEIILLAAQTAVQAVAEFVGDGHDVAQVVVVVAQDVGVKLWRGRGAEGAAAFAFADFRVDPILGEKFSGEGAKFRVEGFEGVKDHLLCFGVGKRPNFFADGRVLVVERKLGQFEQFSFQAKVVVGERIILLRRPPSWFSRRRRRFRWTDGAAPSGADSCVSGPW